MEIGDGRFDAPLPEDSKACAGAQEACSCFRRQIFTKQQAKENISRRKNKEGGKNLWKRLCAAECIYFFIFINLQARSVMEEIWLQIEKHSQILVHVIWFGYNLLHSYVSS